MLRRKKIRPRKRKRTKNHFEKGPFVSVGEQSEFCEEKRKKSVTEKIKRKKRKRKNKKKKQKEKKKEKKEREKRKREIFYPS